MRQKLQNFRKEIRRKELDEYFQIKRQRLFHEPTGATISLLPEGPPTRYQQPIPIEIEEPTYSEAEIYKHWQQEDHQLQELLNRSDHAAALPILNSTLSVLKGVSNQRSILFVRRSDIFHVFLKTPILSNIVKCVLSAERDKCTSGLLQELSKAAVGVLKYAITFEPMEFGQEIFLKSDLLTFLRVCISWPALDADHLSRIINIITHMLVVSVASTGKLFDFLNDISNPIFSIAAPFYGVSTLKLPPEHKLSIDFIIMMKTYLLEIEFPAKPQRQKIPCNLTKNHLDVCWTLSTNAVHHFIRSDFIENIEDTFSFQEGLEVLRVLIEQSEQANKWLRKVDYKGLLNLLRLRECPFEIALKVLAIVDHLIFIDSSEDLAFVFVKDCELLPIIWPLKNDHTGHVLNIMCNLACMPQFKKDLQSYVHQIFLTMRFQPKSYLIYQFIHNWLSSQDWKIKTSKDQLMIKILSQSQSKDVKTMELEAAIWHQLIQDERNSVIVPRRIVEHDNRYSQHIRDQLYRSQTL